MQLPSDAEPPSSSSAGGRAGVLGDFSVFVGNLDPETAVADMEELLYELFLQSGPLSRVYIPFDKDSGKHKCYGFVEFLHQESVPYAITLMHGIRLCGRPLNVRMVTPSATLNSNSSVTMATTSSVTSIPTSSVTMAATSIASTSTPSRTSSSNPFFLALGDTPPPTMPPPPLFPPSHPPPPPHPLQPPPFPFGPPPLPQLDKVLLPPLPKQNSFPPPLPGELISPLFPPENPPPFLPPLLNHTPPRFLDTPPPLFSPPHPLPPPLPIDGRNARLHESRLHAHDHPPWMRNGVKERLSQYHLQELEHTLFELREAMGDKLPGLPPPNRFVQQDQMYQAN